MTVPQSLIKIIAINASQKVFLAEMNRRQENGDAVEMIDRVTKEIEDMIRHELKESKIPVQRKRRAVVLDGNLAQISDYMPANYQAAQLDGYVEISGYDMAGWTLDEYVIPRLASGLINATEVL